MNKTATLKASKLIRQFLKLSAWILVLSTFQVLFPFAATWIFKVEQRSFIHLSAVSMIQWWKIPAFWKMFKNTYIWIQTMTLWT